MQENSEINLKDEIKGEFKINQKYCFFCNKMINIYFYLTEDKLLFYFDKEKKKLYTQILRKLVISINKRFRKQEDKNKLSIYYLEHENSLIVKELKLKANSRLEMDKWISLLYNAIKPKRVEFPTFSNNYVKSNEIFHFENKYKFYVALCNLEYILLKNKLRYIFDIYKNLSDEQYITSSSYNEDDIINI